MLDEVKLQQINSNKCNSNNTITKQNSHEMQSSITSASSSKISPSIITSDSVTWVKMSECDDFIGPK